ncbi:MAG: TonB-dependent receptor [Sphingobium sp.]
MKSVSAAVRRNHNHFVTMSAMALALGLMTSPVRAADAAAASGEGDEGLTDIVVTAEKRQTNLQTTPISISVLGDTALRDRHIQGLGDLMDGAVPSLRIVPFASRSSALSVGIRGIVPFDSNQPSRDAAVGVYIDGVYLGRSQGLGMALLDIERIEVLKGPQGTLFGRNSTGGAVSIVSKKPSGELGLRATVGAGNYGSYRAEAHLDLPRIGDLALKFDGVLTKRDGTVRNPLAGQQDFNQYDKRGFHAAALYDPEGNFSAQVDFDISYDATTPYYQQILTQLPTGSLQPIQTVQPNRATVANVGVPLELSVGKTWGVSLHMEWKAADWATLRSITAYRDLSQSQYDNGGTGNTRLTAGATFSRYSLASLRQNQFSQEVQLLASLPRLEYVGGLFYYHESGDDDAWTPNTMLLSADGTTATPLPVPTASTPFPDRASTAKVDSYAAYAQATYTPPILNDMLKITAGGRLTHDEKSGALNKVNGADTNFPFTFSATRFDPMVTVALDPTRGVHLYGKWGTAYRAGGANSRSVTYAAFGPEKVSTFEIGAKTEFWNRKARLNVAAFTTRYTDIQIDFFASGLDASAPNRTTTETRNAAGRGIIKGIELDASLAPVKGLTLSAAYAYTDGRLPQAPKTFSQPTPNVLTTVYIVSTPDHAYSGSVDYQYDLGFATGKVHFDANAANGYHALSSEAALTGKSFIVNGRVSLADIDISRGANLDVALWARNLFNEQHLFYFMNATTSPRVSAASGIYNEPRTWGVEATLKF